MGNCFGPQCALVLPEKVNGRQQVQELWQQMPNPSSVTLTVDCKSCVHMTLDAADELVLKADLDGYENIELYDPKPTVAEYLLRRSNQRQLPIETLEAKPFAFMKKKNAGSVADKMDDIGNRIVSELGVMMKRDRAARTLAATEIFGMVVELKALAEGLREKENEIGS